MEINGYHQLFGYQHSSKYGIWQKLIQVWNNMRVSKWQNFHFWVNYPFKSGNIKMIFSNFYDLKYINLNFFQFCSFCPSTQESLLPRSLWPPAPHHFLLSSFFQWPWPSVHPSRSQCQTEALQTAFSDLLSPERTHATQNSYTRIWYA